VRCGHGREFKSGPAKPVAMVDSRSGLAGTGANPRQELTFGERSVGKIRRGNREWGCAGPVHK
jgi:hypothetical protein